MVALPAEEILIEETETDDDDEPQNVRYEIMSYPTDYTVKVIYEKWQSSQLVIPHYQRRYVWNLTQASRLIESLLLGLPIPQVFLYREYSSPTLYVVDGHQRLATIARFYNGKFSDNRDFRLRGVNSDWNGKNYSELSEDDRTTLNDATLRSMIIRQIQPNDNSSIYQIFERLNTGGTQLNQMEIRRVIFHGKANGFLEKLNENADWRALIGNSAPDTRYRDVEILLRVLALSENWRTYSKPMKQFITNYMESLDKSDVEHLKQIEQRFSRACSLVKAELGEKPFHLRQRLNLAALDSVMACLMESSVSPKSDLKSAHQELINNQRYLEAVERHTSDVSAIKERFELARGLLTAKGNGSFTAAY